MAGIEGGTIELDLPVSFQNLLEGVIEFTVTDQEGRAVTVVPQAYTPNNDLIISAEHGSIEITNVHPGSSLYNKLELSVNWGSYESTLLSIKVHPGPRVSGVSGFVTWPTQNSVCHHEIENNIQIILDKSVQEAKITVTDSTGNESEYEMSNSVINVPQADLLNAEERRLQMTLTADGQSSYILFLPQVESEDFAFNERIANDGTFIQSAGYTRTGLIPIRYVVDIVYKGIAWGQANSLAAYNENDEFVKILLANANGTYHFEPDGTYTKIAACSIDSTDYALELHFEDVPES